MLEEDDNNDHCDYQGTCNPGGPRGVAKRFPLEPEGVFQVNVDHNQVEQPDDVANQDDRIIGNQLDDGEGQQDKVGDARDPQPIGNVLFLFGMVSANGGDNQNHHHHFSNWFYHNTNSFL